MPAANSGSWCNSSRAATIQVDRKESYLLNLAAEEGGPKHMLRDKVAAIRQEQQQLQGPVPLRVRVLVTMFWWAILGSNQ